MSTFTIPTIFTAVDKFSAPVQKMTKGLEQFDTKAARLQRNFRKISETSFAIAQKSAMVGVAVAAPLVLAGKQASDFEKKMSNVSTLIDTNTESMSNMSKEVLKISKQMPVSIDDLTTSLYDIRSAGIPANQAMATLRNSSILATSGLSTASEATNIMTSAINAFASEGLTSAQISDILFKTVKAGKTTVSEMAVGFGSAAAIIQSSGTKLADFQAATAALTLSGTPAVQAQTQLKASIVALQKPTVEMEKIFKSLGVTSDKEVIKKFGGIGGAFNAINTKGKELGLNVAKAWSSVEASAAVTAITGAANKSYVQTLDDMVNGTNSINSAFEKQMQTSSAQSQLMENNMKALSITIGTKVLPIFNKLLDRLMPIVDRMISWADRNPELLSTIVKVAAGIAALSFVISGVSTVIGIATGAMAAFNIIMALNPITWIIIGIVALTAAVALIIYKFKEWGAGVLAIGTMFGLVYAPVMLVISLVMSLYRHWTMISDAFTKGGFIAGIKAIGVAIFDAILMPIQQILELLGKIPGLGIANTGASKLQEFRNSLVDSATVTEPINPKLAEQNALVSKMETTKNKNVTLTINDPQNRATVSENTSAIPAFVGSTMQSFQ